MANIKVLYEDNHVIAVFKPAGVLSQGDETGDVSMYDMVKDYIRTKKGKSSLLNPGNARPRTQAQFSSTGVFLGLVHRLDRPVCGIILFGKTSKGASRLSEQFRNRSVEKVYQALVVGKPEKEKGILVNKLIKDEKLKKGREHKDGQEAMLHYEVIRSCKPFGMARGEYSLLKIKIEGGKFHQIRSQLSLAGFPILGDVKYSGEKWSDPQSIALCATELSFMTATSDQRVKVSIEIPKEWAKFL